MATDKLASVGTALGNIATNIAGVVPQEGQTGVMVAAEFERRIDDEVRRLRMEGETALAETIATIKHPIARWLSVGF